MDDRSLNGRTPMSLLDTDLGAQKVEVILERIAHGIVVLTELCAPSLRSRPPAIRTCGASSTEGRTLASCHGRFNSVSVESQIAMWCINAPLTQLAHLIQSVDLGARRGKRSKAFPLLEE